MNENKFDRRAKILCWQLKLVCDKKGIETDPSKSAEIIHKLGLVFFRQSCNKISLIQSVGLLNSAIARNPKNIAEVKQDLSKVCNFVLQHAKAQISTADLIEKANQIKDEIESMRIQTNKALRFLKTIQDWEKLSRGSLKSREKTKIKLITKIQNQITQNYKLIMKNISQYCTHIMGPLPCEFAVIGMGSLARKEITPYSDFEHIILLENASPDEKCLEYFRWFSVIFHVIVLNLQETIIPSLNIKYLNDKTSKLGDWFFDTCTSGISFDGMMVHASKFPLGKQPSINKPWTTELIKPVDKMLQYLSFESNLKNGYHLSDILTETCFVYGDKTLHFAFKNGIEAHKNSKTREELLDEIKKQVRDDLNNFATRTRLVNLKPNDNLNVKQTFYRTSTLFITALGKICGTKSSSCFDIINKLAEQRKISENTKHKLSYAVAIACEVRLSVYMNEQSQRDNIQLHRNSKTIFDKVLKFIDTETVVSYFQITYCLQREIIKILGIKENHIYSNPNLMNITICYALRLDALMLILMKKHKRQSSSNFDFKNSKEKVENASAKNEACECFKLDKYIADMEKDLKNCTFKITITPPDMFSVFCGLTDIAFKEGSKNLDEEVELLMRVVDILQQSTLNEKERKKICESLAMDIDSYKGYTCMIIALFLIVMNRYDEALKQMNQALECFDETNVDSQYVAVFFFVAGNNWLVMEEYEQSLASFQIALGISLTITLEQYDDIDKSDVAMMYTGIGICMLNLNQPEEAIIFLKTAVQIIEKNNLPDNNGLLFINRASTYYNLGKCFMKLENSEKAVPFLLQALELTANHNETEEKKTVLTQTTREVFSKTQKSNYEVNILHDLGLLHMKKNCFDEAAIFFQKLFNIYSKLSNAKKIDETRINLLKCFMKISQEKKSI